MENQDFNKSEIALQRQIKISTNEMLIEIAKKELAKSLLAEDKERFQSEINKLTEENKKIAKG